MLPRRWAGFAQKAIHAVKDADPNTRCGVALSDYERDNYLTPFLELNGLDLLGLNVFTLRGLPTFTRMAQAAQARGKAVYIAQTWRPTYLGAQTPGRQSLEKDVSGGVGNAEFTDIDIKWLAAMTRYASTLGLEAVSPLWTQTFFLYVNGPPDGGLDPGYNKQVSAAVPSGATTLTYAAFQRLSASFGATP